MRYTRSEQRTNRRKWTAALRSGEYRQCVAELIDENEAYCCLGVACDLAIKEGVLETSMEKLRPKVALPIEVQEWLGLASCTGTYKGGSLIRANDTLNLTFPEIADIIESEPKGLVV